MTVEPIKTVPRSAEQRLSECRQILRAEMGRAIFCKNDQDKRLLAAGWKLKYSATMFEQLIRVAKDKSARRIIANWRIDAFDALKRKHK